MTYIDPGDENVLQIIYSLFFGKTSCRSFGKGVWRIYKKMSRYCFEDFDVIFDMNEEANYNKMRTYPDGFLYYEIKAELEIYNDHIKLTDRILKLLWDDRITAVASCDYEEELNRYIFSL